MKPLIQVECEIERHGRSRTEYMIRARTAFKARSTAHNLTLTVPLPIDCSTPESKASTGNSGAYAGVSATGQCGERGMQGSGMRAWASWKEPLSRLAPQSTTRSRAR